MKVLITGASGYIGAALLQELRRSYDVVGTFRTNKLFSDLKYLDITSPKSVLETVLGINPDVIIHAAAISSVSYCESEPVKAIETNVKGTKNIVETANDVNAKLIFLSSLGAINPTSQYGKTKLAGEECTTHVKMGFNILRLSVTFGCSPNTTNNQPFNKIIKTLETGKPLSYNSTWKFPPTYLYNISAIIKKILEKQSMNNTITLAIPELKSMYQVARDILKPFGKTVKPTSSKTISSRKETVPENSGFKLPIYTYKDMIQAIIQEIKDRRSCSSHKH